MVLEACNVGSEPTFVVGVEQETWEEGIDQQLSPIKDTFEQYFAIIGCRGSMHIHLPEVRAC